jgi:alkanesulfonate monooxygenase SsuD/methylene tetrahydromethanopterin reductase-like flavin-dependent oxidoreductase (luciferase family)
MEFGLFDHLDRNRNPDTQLYADRLAIIEAAEAAGFRSYHMAEHHMTPLGLGPSPSVFLAAVAQRTRTIRLGPLVYLLPLYHPLRLVEEICMLDQLSGGRLELGVGAGVSPYEVGYFGINQENKQSRYHEALAVVIKGLTSERLDHAGETFRFDNVPMILRPVQTPMPPLWAGVGSEPGMIFAARHGMNAIGLGPTARIKSIVAFYRDAWESQADDPMRAFTPTRTPFMGALRQIHVAETDAQAWDEASPAYESWYAALNWLWAEHGAQVSTNLAGDLKSGVDNGAVIIGAPDTVRAAVAEEVAETGSNYFVLQFAFGTLNRDQVIRSIDLFAEAVMPALA